MTAPPPPPPAAVALVATAIASKVITNKVLLAIFAIFASSMSQSYERKRLEAKRSGSVQAGGAPQRATLLTSVGVNVAIPWVIGRTRVAGTRVYFNTTDNHKKLQIVQAVSALDRPGYRAGSTIVSGNHFIDEVYFGDQLAFTAGTGSTDPSLKHTPDVYSIRQIPNVYQTATAHVPTKMKTELGIDWSDAHAGYGFLWFWITFKKTDGIVNVPEMNFIVNGYDYDSINNPAAYGAHPANVILQLLTNEFLGKNVPIIHDFNHYNNNTLFKSFVSGSLATVRHNVTTTLYTEDITPELLRNWRQVNISNWGFADTASEANVKEYKPLRLNGALDTSETIFDNMEEVIVNSSGHINYSDGKWRWMPISPLPFPKDYDNYFDDHSGGATAVTPKNFHFNEHNIIQNSLVEVRPGATDKINRITCKFYNKTNAYLHDTITVHSPTYQEEDGQILQSQINLSLIDDPDIVERICKRFIYRSRYAREITLSSDFTSLNVSVGDPVLVSMSVAGLDREEFVVAAINIIDNGEIRYQLTENLPVADYSKAPYGTEIYDRYAYHFGRPAPGVTMVTTFSN